MAETADATTHSIRRGDDILMGTFGVPDTGSTIIIAFTGASASSTSFKKQKWYRFVATQDCHLHVHSSAAATTSHMLLKAGIPEVFYMGDNARVAVIQNAAGGNLYATQLMTNDRQA
jgi:hypothetical protein